ncbi:MAG: FecR domain-containing protein [Bacteroidales bacterium]|jgi:ferric-dicitrate binding protein FerR (iron transport regulator)|nr:FecR domain-containing protein [Bacteroidales bacterium]MBQ2543967.1 FecR domain-containing protein [Bacteroidales bacterium]MBQ3942190.1 FecR domain-containing protein [Bacteroidales bacterium]MBQ4026246.1 FecR domain-containing protein [Bacteroidales bacterium]
MLNDNEIQDLLPLYARGEVSPQEGRMLDEWICQSAANRKKAEQYFRIEQLYSLAEASEKTDTDSALRALHSRMRRSRTLNAAGWIKLAAAILSVPLLISTIWLSVQLSKADALPPVQIKSTVGMTTSTTLPDGTRVWLNSNSSLCYPVRFGNTREVTLDGEAFFEVAKDNGRRFLVNAGKLQIEVTGTQFDVEAYSDRGPEVRTTLVSGSVKLHCPDASGYIHTVPICPGEQLCYNSETFRLSRHVSDPALTTAWKDGKILLDNTSLEDALRVIGNRFNVEFMVRNQSLLANRYTGAFSGQTLEVVLEHFKRTTKIHFDTSLKGADPDIISGRQIIIVY